MLTVGTPECQQLLSQLWLIVYPKPRESVDRHVTEELHCPLELVLELIRHINHASQIYKAKLTSMMLS